MTGSREATGGIISAQMPPCLPRCPAAVLPKSSCRGGRANAQRRRGTFFPTPCFSAPSLLCNDAAVYQSLTFYHSCMLPLNRKVLLLRHLKMTHPCTTKRMISTLQTAKHLCKPGRRRGILHTSTGVIFPLCWTEQE